MNDMNDKPKSYGTTCSTTEKSKISIKLSDIFNMIHKFGMWFLIACALGIYVGVSTTKSHYSNKMKESIEVGAFFLDGKVYIITPK